ncbi:hypothetical protein WME91_13890 [Sorangium sp. So ce269]
MKDGLFKDVDDSVREEFKARRRKMHNNRKALERRVPDGGAPRAIIKSKLRTRERWLEESELPAVFQGLRNAAFRNRLNRGFGASIAELYSSRDVDDHWFYRVFETDAAAKVWRERLVESLWAVL